MYWVIFLTGLVLLILLAAKLDGHFLVWIVGFGTYLYFCLGLTAGFCLPRIYVISGEAKLKRAFAPCPWIKHAVNGLEFRPNLDSTYVINASGQPILMRKVLYTTEKALVGTPVQGYAVGSDTLRNTIMSFPSARVAPFKEAASKIMTDGSRCVEMVTVLALPSQTLKSINEDRYRLLVEPSDDNCIDMYYTYSVY